MSASTASSVSGSEDSGIKSPTSKAAHPKRSKSEGIPAKLTEKKASLRTALKKGSGTSLAHLLNKEPAAPMRGAPSNARQEPARPPWGAPNSKPPKQPSIRPPPIQRHSDTNVARSVPNAPQRGNPNYFSSKDLGYLKAKDHSRSPSAASYYSVHEHRRDSIVSQTDTYSIHSNYSRPGSPTALRSQVKAQSSMILASSEKNTVTQPPSSPVKTHRRGHSYVPSIYTLYPNDSSTSLVLAARSKQSMLEDPETIESLSRTGWVEGMFPRHHLVANITRFVRFASASYGSRFLRVLGMTNAKQPTSKDLSALHHHEHSSFSNHTQLPADTILLSSFVDPQGGTDSSGNTNTGIPMVHFVSLDHDSKAVVLTCRGTLGFEDVLTDMTCDYDQLVWRGRSYSVHKGIYASARRLINGSEGRVMATIKAALEEFPDYGLVLCGHSLGGGVTAVLAIMISEPTADGNGFVTAMEGNGLPVEGIQSVPSLSLPSGRPVHAYAYGPPATISPSLQRATRNLVTTIVNGRDLVPYLSLGVLHDLQAVALAFKNDDSGAKAEVRNRVWDGLARGWYSGPEKPEVEKERDDQWAYAALKVLRSSMLSSKLVPPGEVFMVECEDVLAREAFVGDRTNGEEGAAAEIGRLAKRSRLKYVRDVERYFGEVKFVGSMLLDHSPGRYEASLAALGKGVLGG